MKILRALSVLLFYPYYAKINRRNKSTFIIRLNNSSKNRESRIAS